MDRLIERYLDGELTEAEAAELLAALQEDQALEDELRGRERDLAALSAGPSAPAVGFTDRVMAEIAALERMRPFEPVRPRSGMFRSRRVLPGRGSWRGLAWAAALLLCFGLGYLVSLPATNPVPDDGGRDLGLQARDDESLRVVRLFYVPRNSAVGSVTVAGTFNGWDPSRTPLERQNGVWTATLLLPPGTHEYMFVEDGERWVTDPLALQTRDDGFGRANAVLEIPL
jgi:hypothetical protein